MQMMFFSIYGMVFVQLKVNTYISAASYSKCLSRQLITVILCMNMTLYLIDIIHKPKIYIIYWCTSIFKVEIQYKNIIWYDNFQLKL